MVLRLVQLLNLLLLLYGELLLLLIEMVLEQKQHAREEARHDHRAGRVKISLSRGVRQHQIRMKIRNIITAQCLHCTQQEEHSLPPSLQGDTDIDEAEHEPLRHSPVYSASRKEDHGEQHQQEHYRGRRPGIDAPLPDTDFCHYVHIHKACRQYDEIRRESAENQDKNQRDHADSRDQAKHAFSQTDLMVKNDIKPFF